MRFLPACQQNNKFISTTVASPLLSPKNRVEMFKIILANVYLAVPSSKFDPTFMKSTHVIIHNNMKIPNRLVHKIKTYFENKLHESGLK